MRKKWNINKRFVFLVPSTPPSPPAAIVDNVNVIVNNDAGLIEPNLGKVTLNSFRPNDTSQIKITLIPNTLDLAPKRDQLISIDNDFVTITPEIDTIGTAGSSGSINYTNTPRFK